MARESTEDESVRVTLPADLGAWLDDRAADLDVDRDALLVQLLASYRATSELDGEVDADDLEVALGSAESLDDRIAAVVRREVEPAVEETVAGSVAEEVEDVVSKRVAAAVEAALAEQLEARPAAVREELAGRIDILESDVDEKIQDVRERVIQVKREADAKAPADHSHADLERIDGIVTRLAEVESAVGSLADDLAEEADDRDAAVEDLQAQLDEVEERLQTVAWVVSDLREAYESRSSLDAVDRIKRAAAELDVQRARCESCGDGVELSLLTEPTCPHCDATVTNVEAASGFFGKPQLLVASQLESGE